MANLIETNVIEGASVYGVQQVQYTVDGASGKDFIDALTVASFRQSVAIEEAASGYSAVVKARKRKLDDLGKVLAYLSKAVAKLRTTKASSSDTASVDNASWVNETAKSYGITLVFEGSSSEMSRANLMKAQTNIEYAIDKEDNSLQQDLITLQSYVTRRDNAFSTATKVVKKGLDAGASTIKNMG